MKKLLILLTIYLFLLGWVNSLEAQINLLYVAENSATGQPDTTAPSAPTGLLATGGDQEIVVTWTDPTASDLAKIYIYADESSSATTLIDSVDAGVETYTHSGLGDSETWYYRLKAIDDSSNTSDYSSEDSDATDAAEGYLGTTYYVDNTGDGDTLATMTEVEALSLSPGDAVLFKRGCVWYDIEYDTDASGTADSVITYGAYGDSSLAKPRFSSLTDYEGWVQYDGNIYTMIAPRSPGYGVWVDGQSTTWEDSLVHLDADLDLYLGGSDSVYIYFATASDTGLVRGADANNIITADEDYLTFSNLYLNGTGGSSIFTNGVNHIIEYCKMDSSNDGILVGTDASNTIIRNDTITNNSGNGIFINTRLGGEVSNSYIANNGIGVVGELASTAAFGDRQELGIWASNETMNIHDNTIIHDVGWSSAIEMAGLNGTNYGTINFYNNTIEVDSASLYSIQMFSHYFDVYNNIFDFSGMTPPLVGQSLYMGQSGDTTVVDFYNNTVIGSAFAVRFCWNDGYTMNDTSLFRFRNNAFIDIDSTFIMESCNANSIDSMASRIVFDYNYIDTAGIDFEWIGENTYTFADWQGVALQDRNSTILEPYFGANYTLSDTSTLINQGIDVGLTEDILGNSVTGYPDIGAYQTSVVGIAAPTSVSVSGDTGFATITWTDPSGSLDSVYIYDGANEYPSSLVAAVGSSVETYIDSSATEGLRYYRVRAKDTNGIYSQYSASDSDSVTASAGSVYAIDFNGTDEGLYLSSGAADIFPDATDSLIVDFWYKPNSTASNQYLLVIGYYNHGTFIRHTSTDDAQIYMGTSIQALTNKVTQNTWHHVIWKLDFSDSTSTIYIDEATPIEWDGWNSEAGDFYDRLEIGSYAGATQFYANAYIGEVKITRKNSSGTTLYESYYDWKGDSDAFITDKGDAGNDLTSANITLADRIEYSDGVYD